MRGRDSVIGGFVYVFKNSNNEFKVGSTNNIKNRISNIKCGCPSAEVLFKSAVLSNRNEVEKAVHQSLYEYSVGGEWFNCSEEFVLLVTESAISNIGLVISEGQSSDADEIESELEWCKTQAAGVLCKSHATTEKQIIDRYIYFLETRCLKQLSWFNKKCPAEQFLLAATVLANTLICNEENAGQLKELGFK
tara:strand:- start:43 stop:618 length:576 start_codon:yes stop_codon:yes gene_type:complete